MIGSVQGPKEWIGTFNICSLLAIRNSQIEAYASVLIGGRVEVIHTGLYLLRLAFRGSGHHLIPDNSAEATLLIHESL